MNIDRDRFFAEYRSQFGPIKNFVIVNNLQIMLDGLEKWQDRLNPKALLQQMAYVAATVHHETGATYGTFKEQRQVATDTPRRKEVKRLQDRYWNTGYYGRGPVQLTWKAEYEWAEKATGRPLLSDPDLLLRDLPLGYEVTIKTMTDPSINGKCMNDYLNENKTDYVDCRRVVNILDQAQKIAGYAEKFYQIFNASVEE